MAASFSTNASNSSSFGVNSSRAMSGKENFLGRVMAGGRRMLVRQKLTSPPAVYKRILSPTYRKGVGRFLFGGGGQRRTDARRLPQVIENVRDHPLALQFAHR